MKVDHVSLVLIQKSLTHFNSTYRDIDKNIVQIVVNYSESMLNDLKGCQFLGLTSLSACQA